MSVPLERLSAAVAGARITGDAGTSVLDLAYDSRHVTPGALFFCVPGARSDGHDHAGAAVAAGAASLVVERPLDLAVPQVLVPRVREAMGPMASTFFEHPSRSMTVVGVTGTNGKTTTTYMLASVFRSLGLTPGLTGTVQTRIGEVTEAVERTTPEGVDLQRLYARMRDAGVDACASEVSSHGLAWRRVDGTSYACAVFTNLTQDHLDDHGSMEAYFDAKAMLFARRFTDRAVINVDDAYGRALLERTELTDVVTVAMAGNADVTATVVSQDAGASRATIRAGGREHEVRVPLPARYNVANALCVAGVGIALGWDVDDVLAGIAATPDVPGRLERIDEGQPFTILVDYAHTDDALANVLTAARGFTPEGARLVVVFGCGGDRDRGKRPRMGAAAASLADRVVITSDNPRSEDPRAIVAAIEEGTRDGNASVVVEPDRGAAIELALHEAGEGDVVVIAGKGHETGQEFAHETIPFDDRAVAREIAARLVRR